MKLTDRLLKEFTKERWRLRLRCSAERIIFHNENQTKICEKSNLFILNKWFRCWKAKILINFFNGRQLDTLGDGRSSDGRDLI